MIGEILMGIAGLFLIGILLYLNHKIWTITKSMDAINDLWCKMEPQILKNQQGLEDNQVKLQEQLKEYTKRMNFESKLIESFENRIIELEKLTNAHKENFINIASSLINIGNANKEVVRRKEILNNERLVTFDSVRKDLEEEEKKEKLELMKPKQTSKSTISCKMSDIPAILSGIQPIKSLRQLKEEKLAEDAKSKLPSS